MGQLGQVDQGLQLLDEAQQLAQVTAERFYEAELYRLKGVLLLRRDRPDEAAACFGQALDVARRQQTRAWELRAATSLSRLWRRQGKCREAYDLLAPVYSGFTEGFETADLRDAKAQLDALAG